MNALLFTYNTVPPGRNYIPITVHYQTGRGAYWGRYILRTPDMAYDLQDLRMLPTNQWPVNREEFIAVCDSIGLNCMWPNETYPLIGFVTMANHLNTLMYLWHQPPPNLHRPVLQQLRRELSDEIQRAKTIMIQAYTERLATLGREFYTDTPSPPPRLRRSVVMDDPVQGDNDNPDPDYEPDEDEDRGDNE